jgi:hypothetical protein
VIYLSACVAVFALGYVAVLSNPCCSLPFPLYSLAVFAPFVLLSAVLLERLFPVRPVLLSALSALVNALVQSGEIALESPHNTLEILRDTSGLLLIFLLGVPAAVYAIRHLRSNQRLERP